MKLKRMISKVQRGYISLRMRFVAVFIIAAISAVVLYVASNVGAHYYIKNVYLSDENKAARETAYHEDLQQYIRDNGITFESIDRVSEWAKDNQYVYLMIYKEQTDDEALFIPDDMVDKFPTGGGLLPGGTLSPGTGADQGDSGTGTDTDAGEGDKDPDLGGENEDENTENGDTGDGQSPNEGENDPDGTEPGEGDPDGGDTSEDNTPEDDTPTSPTPDDKPEDDEPLGGITINWPTRSELEAEAKSRDMLFIELPENQYVYAKFAEYTEYLYYDIANIACIVLGVLTLLTIFLIYITRLTKRISRLGQEVTIVAAGETDKHITVSGEDEISELATNVESMRSTIVENYKKEKEALDSNTALITSMSHDIRTPLTVLFGYIDVMKARAGDDEVMQGYISAAESTAQRLKNLSDDMFGYFLVFGKDETALSIEEYDAVTLIEQMLTEHIFLMREQGYNVEMTLESERLANRFIRTDTNNMVRILGNVFSNLIKYAEPKKPINISIYLSGEYVVAEFFNSVRTDTERVESNRIGLKTCQKLAEKMGAKFESFALSNDFYVKLSLPIV
ncbi:MAG: HAMP domain-containing protein [Clostridia bacterium]|nr:HAMP domain-containing protein [Clostridia bacterium]